MSKEEYVEVNVRVPKPIMDFLEAYCQFVGYKDETAEQYLAEQLTRYSQEFVGDTVFNAIVDDAEAIIKKYRLEPYRKNLGIPKPEEAEAK